MRQCVRQFIANFGQNPNVFDELSKQTIDQIYYTAIQTNADW